MKYIIEGLAPVVLFLVLTFALASAVVSSGCGYCDDPYYWICGDAGK